MSGGDEDMMTELRCKICFRLLRHQRRATFPSAVTCGKSGCQSENRRRVHSAHALHTQRRARAAAKKELAERAPWANRHAPNDTSPPKTWAEALERFAGPVTSSEGVGGAGVANE